MCSRFRTEQIGALLAKGELMEVGGDDGDEEVS